MKIRIPKWTQTEWLIGYILFINFIVGMTSSFIPQAYSLFYTIDIANIILLLYLIHNKSYKRIAGSGAKILLYWLVVFTGYALIVSIINMQSPALFLWAVRNNFRYYVFFLACIVFGKGSVKIFDKLIWINFFAVLFEFLFLGKIQDWVGGIFGWIGGDVNAPLNIFLLIITINSIIYYLNKKENLSQFLLKCAGSFVIAAISELKVFYIEFAVVIMFAMLFTRFTYKKMIVAMAFAMGAVISVQLLYLVIPELDPEFFTFVHMYRYVTSHQGYTSTGDMNRFTFIRSCNEILQSTIKMIFGMGMGNCEVATNIGWYSAFYKQYAYTHYNWFSSSFIYLELGLIGMILYFGFFAVLFLQIRKIRKAGEGDFLDCQIGEILSLMVIMLLFYNTSMRGNYAYLIYYVLSLPFMKKRMEKEKRKLLEI